MSQHSRRAPRRRVRRRTLILGGLAVVLLVLVVPMLLAAYEARAAKSDLETAKSALQKGDYPAAKEAVDRATQRAGRADWLMNSPIGDFWSVLPLSGGATDDVRLMTRALDSTADVADIGVQLYPQVAGDHATLMKDGSVSPATLKLLVTGVQQAGAKLESADRDLEQVKGDTPLIGGSILGSRDGAYAQIHPMADAYRKAAPLVAQLPTLFGMDGPHRYLLAMLNPAELRYSGGAALSLAGLATDHGQLELKKSLDLEDSIDPSARYSWKKVAGNPFHHRGQPMPLRNSTFAPSWSISGQELLRAVSAGFHKGYSGVITVDVSAMADLLRITGPLEVPGYDTLTADNLVQTLVGSYDKYPDPGQRHALNQAIIPAFKDRLLDGGHMADKIKSLTTSAQGGHFAVYMRDPDLESALQSLGMAGDLSSTADDYLGVFTQNTNGSKVDILQGRTLGYDVMLNPDGSADATLHIKIDNPTPPYAQAGPDPGFGYFTRYAGMSVAPFLADGTHLEKVQIQGKTVRVNLRDFYGRPWFSRPATIDPGGSLTMTVSYHIANAASVNGNALTYDLTFQPQGTVVPPSLSVNVQLPSGYRASEIPTGWTSQDGILSLAPSAQPTLTTWEISAERAP